MFDIVKFAKLMQLSTSTYEGEALNAIRMANAILAEADLSWDDFISQKEIIINEIEYKDNENKDNIQKIDIEECLNIEEMFTMCLYRIKVESGLNFIKSLKEFYDRRGYLTVKQQEALKKWYENIANRHENNVRFLHIKDNFSLKILKSPFLENKSFYIKVDIEDICVLITRTLYAQMLDQMKRENVEIDENLSCLIGKNFNIKV